MAFSNVLPNEDLASVVSGVRDEPLELSPFQQRVMSVPETLNIFLGGGRGGAKSHAMAFLALRHATQYGEKARILYLRQTYKGLADFEQITRELFGRIYGGGARFNQTDGVWRLPNGAYFELGQLEGVGDYQKYQGRSFTLLMVDEAGQYATPDLLDRLRSNLRGPAGMPIRQICAANPGDVGHAWLAKRYVFKGVAPWQPFEEPATKSRWCYCPSTYKDNPFIDQDEYRRQLEASCPTDRELLQAWLDGNWAIARGAFFGSVLDEATNAVDPWQLPLRLEPERTQFGRGLYLQASADPWRFYLAHDFGVSAPSVTYVCAESPGGKGADGQYYPRGSVLLLDELATYVPNRMNEGLVWTVPKLAEAIKEMCAEWGMKPKGVADDAIFANVGASSGSIAEEFRKAGVTFRAAKKADRISGHEIMRRMLQDAGSPDKPGLYVARNCEYFWATVPYLARDPREANDLDSRGPDHAADACRYAVLKRDGVRQGPLFG